MSGLVVLVLRILLALALYGFLGLSLWTIWLDLKRTGIKTVSYQVKPIRLEVRIKKKSPFYRSFSRSEIIIGRDPSCDLSLEDEAVSAYHAKLSFHHGQWWLEDLDSTNGTKLNLDKLTTATVVISGDEIKCGKAQLVINLDSKSLRTKRIPFKEQHDQ
jgi:pSer/pThr/pTyr-binding forkhead associated (FHA) protein